MASSPELESGLGVMLASRLAWKSGERVGSGSGLESLVSLVSVDRWCEIVCGKVGETLKVGSSWSDMVPFCSGKVCPNTGDSATLFAPRSAMGFSVCEGILVVITVSAGPISGLDWVEFFDRENFKLFSSLLRLTGFPLGPDSSRRLALMRFMAALEARWDAIRDLLAWVLVRLTV